MYCKEKENIIYREVYVSKNSQWFAACRNKIIVIGSITKFLCGFILNGPLLKAHTYRIEIINQKADF